MGEATPLERESETRARARAARDLGSAVEAGLRPNSELKILHSFAAFQPPFDYVFVLPAPTNMQLCNTKARGGAERHREANRKTETER